MLIDRDLNVEFANDRARELLGAGTRLDEIETAGEVTTEAIARLALDLFTLGLPGHIRVEHARSVARLRHSARRGW